PSDSECSQIQDLLVDPRKQLADISQQIVEIQQHLEELTRKRDELLGFIDAHLALVSPLRRLPGDVICAIFIACMPSHRNAVMSPEDPPLILSQISKPWRLLAFSTPQLWASLHIVIPHNDKMDRLVDMVEAWFSRSGVPPLSISL
ncbi:hypothetical protein B0H11DRAFT_2307935, partial [Mycena galericulata]